MGVSANDASAAASAAPAAPTASAAVKKYHLVEAEEVDAQQRVKAPGSATKKKGKTNWSQFPVDSAAAAALTDESVDSTGSDDSASQRNGTGSTSTATTTTPNSSARRGSNGGRGSGSRPFHNGGRGPRRNYDSNGAYINGVYVPNTDPKITAQYAKEQIEFYFSPDNLVRDIFLRQHMDVDGYVPLAFVGSFQAVFAVHQDYATLLDAMRASESVELDVVNEKVRLRDGWQQWLWPNADGGYGVPAYIKATTADADATSA